MEERPLFDRLQIGLARPHLTRQAQSVQGDPEGVPVRIGVTTVESGPQGQQRGMIRLLEQFQRLPELLGSACDLLLQVLLVPAVFQQQAAFLESAGDNDRHFLQAEGLQDVVIRSMRQRIYRDVEIGYGRYQDHRRVGTELLCFSQQRQAPQLRHHEVGKNKIVGRGGQEIQCCQAVFTPVALIAQPFEFAHQDIPDQGFIFHDQNAEPGRTQIDAWSFGRFQVSNYRGHKSFRHRALPSRSCLHAEAFANLLLLNFQSPIHPSKIGEDR